MNESPPVPLTPSSRERTRSKGSPSAGVSDTVSLYTTELVLPSAGLRTLRGLFWARLCVVPGQLGCPAPLAARFAALCIHPRTGRRDTKPLVRAIFGYNRNGAH